MLIDQYRQMHESPDMFQGFSMMPHIHRIKKLIDLHGAQTILDYGCGKGKQYEATVEAPGGPYPNLEAFWGVAVSKYDPAYPPYSRPPFGPFDGVVCTDVLEHLESEEDAGQVVATLFSAAKQFVFASISCKEAVKTLPDGRNAHTLIRDPEWWKNLFCGFDTPWVIVCTDAQKQVVFSNFDWREQQKIEVKTRNCVPDEQICAQVEYAQSLGLPWAVPCRPNDDTVVVVSGGPSWTHHIEAIRALQNDGAKVVCVKSSHDELIRQGIVPWGCCLLDPREKVRDFVSNPHPEVRYFTATMVHKVTLDRLIEKNAKVFLYHALVGAGEHEIADRNGMMILGGSSAAMRFLPMLRFLGFRHFKLFGFDACFGSETKVKGYESAHVAGEQLSVAVNGKEFNTDTELLAQVQDFNELMGMTEKSKGALPGCRVEVIGEGIIPHVWGMLNKNHIETRLDDVY